MVSFLHSTRIYLRRHLVDIAFLTAASLIAAVFFFTPESVVGSSNLLPDPTYEPLLALFDDSASSGDKTGANTGTKFLSGGEDSLPVSDPNKFFTSDSLRKDTLGTSVPKKSVASDSGYVVYLDSTARLSHFAYVRRDQPQVRFFPDRSYSLFAPTHSATYKREVVMDSLGRDVVFRETVGGKDVKIPISVPLREYVALRQKAEFRRMLADEARKPKVVAERNDLGELMANITQIQIPIPPNPIFSIFGKPEIKLNISGAVDIKAGFRNTKSDQTQVSLLDQSRNEPDFAQEVQVNVNGTIGDKLNILADWNTQRTFEYENQLKIKYTGYEDEIVQSIEAGNVSLQTPSSFIGSSQALFGVKARFQTGPLTLTTLASQKKGQIKEVAVSGGAQEVPISVQPHEYATNHFFVNTLYRQFYENYYREEPALVTNPELQIVDAEVWVTRQGSIPDPNEREGIAFIELPPRGSGYDEGLRGLVDSTGGTRERGLFVKLNQDQYDLDGYGYIGVLSLKTNVQDQQIVAIAYRTAGNASTAATQYGEFTRDLDTSRTLILKMVKPKNLHSNSRNFTVAWDQLLKNIYPLGGRNIKKSGFELDVYRTIAAAEKQNSIENERLLRIFGLDKFNADDTPNEDGDNVFDFRPGRTINLASAEIIFPHLRPFDTGIKEYFIANGLPLPDSTFFYPQVYDTTKSRAAENNNAKYAIQGRATGDATSKYSLGFNVVEGSVQVLLNGNRLTPNVDYSVDYIIGEVVIRNAAALVPGANLQIKYEQNDLFQLASKTLLGARGDLALSQTTNIGFTIMNLNQRTLSDKVRLGEEPNNNTILGIDGATSFNLPFLTKAIDALPLLDTREASQLKVSGEAAYMIPDPNTMKSSIPSDGGEGVAYIDDFEGARRTIPLGTNYTQWTQGGPPADTAWGIRGLADTTKMYSKGKIVWFNLPQPDTRLTDVFPNKRPGSEVNNRITLFDVRYFPQKRGQFNYSPDLNSTMTSTQNWGSIMKPISVAATNLVNENISFIELWMKVERAPLDAKMVIDLGAISEDIIPNRRLNTEDLVLPASTINGTLQEGEDVGLDMLPDVSEPGYDPANNPDPSGDNYSYNNADLNETFERINGTDNNKNSPSGLIPDTEDLNSNGIADPTNQYMQYELSLDTDTTRNRRIVGGGNAGWYQFRIPIREYTRLIGGTVPNFENVEYIRVSFLNVPQTDTIAVRIADFSLVGNQWQELRKEDTTFVVSVVSVEDNLDYRSPPGVIRERDKTRPDEEVLANEQSLSLLLKGVPEGQSRHAVKFYTYKPLDLFNYRRMKMFVHGDEAFRDLAVKPQIFYRFGLDSLNYYEYRGPIYPGWDERNEVDIDFRELTSIKQLRDSVNQSVGKLVRLIDGDSVAYSVRGNPSLTQVRYLAIGVTHRYQNGPGGPAPPLTAEVWVNELRLIEVDDSKGWAYRFDTQLKLADLGSVSFNYSRVDPNFHTLEQRFGSRQTGTNWGISTSMSLERFFPSDWVGTSFPVSYSRSVGRVEPKYLPNSDVLVSEAAEQERQKMLTLGYSEAVANAAAGRIIRDAESYRETDTYAAPSFRIGFPSNDWFIRDTFNKLTLGFNYTKSRERNPAISSRVAWSWNAKISYALNLSPDYYVQPFKSLFDGLWFLDEYKNLKIFYTPTSFTWSFTAVRSRDVSTQRTVGAQQLTSRNFTASRQFGFGWKATEGGIANLSGNYNLSIESSLLDLETDRSKQQRPFSKILDDIFFGDKFINFGTDTRYAQQNQFTSRPNIPNIFNIKKYADFSMSYGVDYNWQNTQAAGDIGKSAGWSNNINFSMNFKLKQLFDPLFDDKPTAATPVPRGRRGAAENEGEETPGTTQPASDTTGTPQSPGGLEKTLAQLKTLARALIKVPFLDYDNINITFTQSNNVGNSGVVGRTGFVNFWGRVPFFQEADPKYGPSRLYQLGLISDPNGKLTNFGTRSYFPFFGWDVEPGIRAASIGGLSANLSNTFRQSNRVTLKTNRSLWEGARLDLTWNTGWQFSRTQNVTTDSLGTPRLLNASSTGSVDRSFLTFPDVLFLGMFKSSLKDVSKRYKELKDNRDSTVTNDEKLAQAFEEGFEALPFLRKIFGQYFPRVNWTLRWDGLEKIPMFAGFVSRLSLDHSYNANYTRSFENRPGGGGERTNGQRVAYGFAPLFGLNFTFKELLKGSFGANLRYNTNTSFDLATSSQKIVETLAQEISFTASYSRKGFEIPLFGLALNNDLDVSASYSLTKNSRKTYDVSKLDVAVTPTPLEGSTRTVIEPRIKYVLSLRVTASVYYRYTKIAPDEGGSRIPGSTINEAGLDIHISIQ